MTTARNWLLDDSPASKLQANMGNAYRMLLQLLRNPLAVVGFGGYASVPTMLASTYGGYSTAIHEQNAVLGRANRLLAPRVGRIATSFEYSRGLPAEENVKVVHTGMPVRPAIALLRDRPYHGTESC